MKTAEPIAPAQAPADWPARLLMLAAATLLALYLSGFNACLYEHGSLPYKPRDFTLGLSALCFALAAMQRLAFAPAALGLLLLPALRLADAAILARYTPQKGGGLSALVALLLAVLLVCSVIVAVLATPAGRLTVYRGTATALVLLCGSVVYESLGLANYTAIPGRAAGFLTQPNETCIGICLLLGIVLTLGESFWPNVLMVAVAVAGVGLTLSRSGMLVLAMMITLFVALNLRQHFSKLLLISLLSIPASGVGIAYIIKQAESRNFGTDTNARQRVEAIFGGGVDKMESAERMKDLTDGWEGVTKSPLIGHGTGISSTHYQPHNQWVAIWLDIGLIGVGLYALSLIGLTAGCLLAKGTGLPALLPLWLFSAFSQNLVENPIYWCAACVIATLVTKKRVRFTLRRSAAKAD